MLNEKDTITDVIEKQLAHSERDESKGSIQSRKAS
jgi:hypothetical protein